MTDNTITEKAESFIAEIDDTLPPAFRNMKLSGYVRNPEKFMAEASARVSVLRHDGWLQLICSRPEVSLIILVRRDESSYTVLYHTPPAE